MIAYGHEAILDLYKCNTDKFTRHHLRLFFKELCAILKMKPEKRVFWDDTQVLEDERETDPKTKGISAVQFIIYSNITIHCLELLEEVYINVFSCKEFDRYAVNDYCVKFFEAEKGNFNGFYRGENSESATG